MNKILYIGGSIFFNLFAPLTLHVSTRIADYIGLFTSATRKAPLLTLILLRITCWFLYPIFRHSRYYSSFVDYCKIRLIYLRLRHLDRSCSQPDSSVFPFLQELLVKDNQASTAYLSHLLSKEIENNDLPPNIDYLRDLFQDKSIMIQGPGHIDFSSFDYNSYDLICLPNSLSKDFPSEFYNKVVLFVNNAFYARNRERFNDILPSLKTALLPLPDPRSSLSCIANCNHLLFNNYGPIAFTRILYTLLLSAPLRVDTYGFDAYSNPIAYRDDIKNYSHNPQHYSNNLRIHEPFSNFAFARFIGLSQLLNWSNFESTVFSKTTIDYSKMLDVSLSSLPYRPTKGNNYGTILREFNNQLPKS